MQTKPYGDLFKLIRSLAGVTSFTSQEQGDISRLINRRLNKAYNTSPIWDRYVVSNEERNVNSFTLSGLSDSDTNTVYNGAYYLLGLNADTSAANVDAPVYVKSKENTNSNPIIVTKSSSTNQWTLKRTDGVSLNLDGTVTITAKGESSRLVQIANDDGTYEDFDNPSGVQKWTLTGATGFPIFNETSVVAFDETYFNSEITSSGKTPKSTIGEFIRIHRKKAFLNNSALEYDFFINSDGANILNITSSDDTFVFVTYKKPLTEFTTSSDFENSTEEVPEEFFHYLAHSVYADFLRMDGQHGKALTEEQLAQDYLDTQLEKIDIRSNNNSINKKFSTHVNRQSR
jgi:hypothetical protein